MRVVIIGGGYGGLFCAARLVALRVDCSIVVVEPRADFCERIRLHQAAAGQALPRLPIGGLLPQGVVHIAGRVDHIGAGEVSVGGRRLPNDRLVVALGARVRTLPGALPLDGRPLPGGRRVVVGGGLTGLELACELGDCSWVAPTGLSSHVHGRGVRAVERTLAARGVRHVVDQALAVEGATLRLASGDTLPADVVVGSLGLDPDPLLARLPPAQDGRVAVDACLRVGGRDDALAIGDCAAIGGLRPSCALALPMGAQAAAVLAADAAGRRSTPFRWRDPGWCVSLGRDDGVLQWAGPDGAPTGPWWTGRLAAVVKEQVCRYPLRMLRAELRFRRPLYQWLQAPLQLEAA